MLLSTPKATLGTSLHLFKLSDANGRVHDFSELKGVNGTLVAFICNHCPYVKAIIERLNNDAKKLSDIGINLIAINSNDYLQYPADSPEKMKEFIKNHKLIFPYLVDEDQSIAKKFGAVCTPDFFGYNSDNKLQYRGRLDDLKMNELGNRKAELLEAMEMISETGIGPDIQNPSMGCSIKWK